MSLTRTATIEVRGDHTATLELPPEIPAGPVTITYTVEESVLGEAKPDETPRTGADVLHELISEGLIGDWADRDDLPKTPEEFAAWRKKIWEGEPY